MRRLAIEDLKVRGLGELPEFRSMIRQRSIVGTHAAKVHWAPKIVSVESWQSDAPKDSIVATLTLEGGVQVKLKVDVSTAWPDVQTTTIGDQAVIAYRFPLPADRHLRNAATALEEVRRQGVMQWVEVPARVDSVQVAIQEIDLQRQAERTRIDEFASQRSAQAGRRWAAIARTSRVGVGFRPSMRVTAASSNADRQNDVLADRLAGSALTAYKFDDGSTWLRYMRSDRRYLIVPFPGRAQDGWEQALPASVGRFRPELQGYLLTDVFKAMEVMASLSSVVKNGRNLSEFGDMSDTT